MRDAIVAAVRTALQSAVAAGLAWLGGAVGVDVPEEYVTLTVLLLLGVVVLVLNWLGERFPLVNSVLSLGMSSSTPSYEPKHLSP